ncbi:hypothetical protein AMS68_007818 [Peltaster fructicola]|uniref:CNNM transmembrane domain-containing protein n=1 Tax=Peltaster fructicola TaxID=286661 RepID=A0A6H0Y5U2_9PEZI|nr:hypothetical protein AMS68_007818 [Peltaster fructicola]
MSEARRGQPQSYQPRGSIVSTRPNSYAYSAVTLRPAVLGLAKLALIPLVSAAPTALLTTRGHNHGEDGMDSEDPDLWIYLSIAIALVLLGGAFAGLTIALMGQDETYLQVIASSGEGKERKNAKTVLDLLGKGKHWVLVTLLLSNVITNETLPIVLDRSLGGGWPAVVSIIFGEIVPQSICVRYGLSIGAWMAPLVLGLMYIMCIVAWPTAKLLDYLLGEDHGTSYNKPGLKTLVQLHKTLGTTPSDRLTEDEVTIINSVLDLKVKPVGDIMTPMGDVFTMSADTVLDEKMMDTVLSQGYSRIPIHAPNNNRDFIGMLLVKILITYDPEDSKRVRDFALATLPETLPNTSCLDIINFFQEGKSHMVLVSDFPGTDKGAMGVVTLEDVIEELIGEEIIDESDVFVDVHKAIRRMAPAPRTRYSKQFLNEENPDKEPNESDSLLPKEENNERPRKAGVPNGTNTTLMMRRKSSNASDSTRDTVKPIRSNATDLRQHLKHLGPSNAASKPRSTKYTSVKIKPGVGTIPEMTAADSSHYHSDALDILNPGPDGGEGAGLLRNAGLDARDGVSAISAGYGTIPELHTRPRTPARDEDSMSAKEASEMANKHVQSPRDGSTNGSFPSRMTNNKLVIGDVEEYDENDTVGDMEGPSRDKSARRTARSGSITETTVDLNGMQKVVLETTSSSENMNEDAEKDSPKSEEGESFFGGSKKKKRRGKKSRDDSAS